MSALLQIEDLAVEFRTGGGIARAVDGLSLAIGAGETYALVGESGCGKSVTAQALLGLLPFPAANVTRGRAWFEGRDLLAATESELRAIRGARIGMIFQEPQTSLNPVFTAGAQVAEAVRVHGAAATADRTDLDLLARVGLPDPVRAAGAYPHQLSGGMRQRVMIAIALAARPSLLLADEPTTALDVTVQAQILDLLAGLQRDLGLAVLLITHNLDLVRERAQRVGVMYAGRLVEEAPAASLFRAPLHPYTRRLLEALPAAGRRGAPLAAIPGTVPAATAYPAGCRFAPRCADAMRGCAADDPRERVPAADRRIACHLDDRGWKGDRTATPPAPEPAAARRTPPSAPEPLLLLSGLAVRYPVRGGLLRGVRGSFTAVDGVDLAVPRGSVAALVGESGCGKTTLGKAALRLIEPSAGSVWFRGTDVTKLGPDALRVFRKRMQIVFQDPYASLNPRLTVGETVGEGLQIHGLGGDREARATAVGRALERVGLDAAVARRYPHEFSGGQRQRIGIARALAVEPEFIVCDEATSALDVSVQAQILNLLRGLKEELGLTYLFITHDLALVRYFADHVSVMREGRIVEAGAVDEVLHRPRHEYTRTLLAAVPQGAR